MRKTYNELIGFRVVDLTEQEKDYLLKGAIVDPNNIDLHGRCLVDFANGLTAEAQIEVNPNENIFIFDEYSILYDSKEGVHSLKGLNVLVSDYDFKACDYVEKKDLIELATNNKLYLDFGTDYYDMNKEQLIDFIVDSKKVYTCFSNYEDFTEYLKDKIEFDGRC